MMRPWLGPGQRRFVGSPLTDRACSYRMQVLIWLDAGVLKMVDGS